MRPPLYLNAWKLQMSQMEVEMEMEKEMEMEIKVKRWSMVEPAIGTPKHALPVSNLDLLVSRIFLPTVYFYKPTPPNHSSVFFFDASRLKDALSDALVQFYPLAGRLGFDHSGRFQINCTGEGVLFQEAETDSFMPTDFTPTHHLRRFIPHLDVDDDDESHVSSHPLLLLQLTRFKCGGVCLGVAIHHMVADGSAALHFINSWSDVTRGIPIAIPPFLDRTVLRARDPPAPIFPHVEHHPPPPPLHRPIAHTSASTTRVFHLTPHHLSALKTKSKSPGPVKPFTTYETLAAHFWRCACKARGLSLHQPTKLYIPLDGRSRLRPTLSPGYFGNAVFTCTVTATWGELEAEALGRTAERIHDALARMDDEYLRSSIDYLEMQPDLTPLVRGAHTFGSPNLVVGNWTRLPTHDADFGWGRPIHMGLGSGLFEGNICIQRNPTHENHLSIVTSLDAQPMKFFKDYLFDI